jgi:hypothetical protein
VNKREIPPLHEIAKLEYQFRFLYFLRDLGIQSANIPAKKITLKYMVIQAELAIGG